MERIYKRVEGQWEERFERLHGFWRGFVDDIVSRFSDCGLFESDFAKLDTPPTKARLTQSSE